MVIIPFGTPGSFGQSWSIWDSSILLFKLQEKVEGVQLEAEKMGIMEDNQDNQDKQVRTIIKAMPMEVVQALKKNQNVLFVKDLMQI